MKNMHTTVQNSLFAVLSSGREGHGTYEFFHSSSIGLQDGGKVERTTGCLESVLLCGGHCSVVKAYRMCENNIATGISICQSVSELIP